MINVNLYYQVKKGVTGISGVFEIDVPADRQFTRGDKISIPVNSVRICEGGETLGNPKKLEGVEVTVKYYLPDKPNLIRLVVGP